jgi:hypothetical protein
MTVPLGFGKGPVKVEDQRSQSHTSAIPRRSAQSWGSDDLPIELATSPRTNAAVL